MATVEKVATVEKAGRAGMAEKVEKVAMAETAGRSSITLAFFSFGGGWELPYGKPDPFHKGFTGARGRFCKSAPAFFRFLLCYS